MCPGPDCFITASKLRTQHQPCITQADFINSFYYADKFVEAYSTQIVQNPGAVADLDGVPPVFPYSIFYVYFEQYLTIQGIAFENTLLALGMQLLNESSEVY